MRGARARPADPARDCRIIPAYAGSTHQVFGVRDRKGDHPRVCGEHDLTLCRPDFELGSSPRMRGARLDPAMPWPTRGSSPRMRGAHIAQHADPVGARIIPAYAGSTGMREYVMSEDEDHPRVCGEHNERQAHHPNQQGSSPRMRGAQTIGHRTLHDLGIIPAYAGSTDACCQQRPVQGDHPRVCGEHPGRARTRAATPGSSPRMRGAHILVLRNLGLKRIIPAYAGSTTAAPRPTGPIRDHPRVCGEHRAE